MKANIVYQYGPDGKKLFKFFTSSYTLAQMYRDAIRRSTSWKRNKNDWVVDTIGIQPFESRTVEVALIEHGIEYTKGEYTLCTDFDESNIVCDYTILFDKVTDTLKVLSTGELHINPPRVTISFQRYPITDGEIYLHRDMQRRYYLSSCVTYNGRDYDRFNKMYIEITEYLESHNTVRCTYEEMVQMIKPILNQYIAD